MDDQAIEQQIQAKGLTAPRVTPSDLAANIASVHYFTAADGDFAVTREMATPALGLLTFCVLVLRNGFTVTGESACASPENFDAEICRRIARDNAEQKVWPLMGYELKQQLHQRAVFDASPKVGYASQPPVDNAHDAPGAEQFTAAEIAVGAAIPAYQQRVIDEFNELMVKAIKLREYSLAPSFQRLADEEQVRLGDQLVVMTSYADILQQRIGAF